MHQWVGASGGAQARNLDRACERAGLDTCGACMLARRLLAAWDSAAGTNLRRVGTHIGIRPPRRHMRLGRGSGISGLGTYGVTRVCKGRRMHAHMLKHADTAEGGGGVPAGERHHGCTMPYRQLSVANTDALCIVSGPGAQVEWLPR